MPRRRLTGPIGLTGLIGNANRTLPRSTPPTRTPDEFSVLIANLLCCMITSEKFTCVLIAVASSLKVLELERNQRLGSQRVPKNKRFLPNEIDSHSKNLSKCDRKPNCTALKSLILH